MNYCRTQPCNNCPYRMDAPLQHWAKEEFENLMSKDLEFMGSTFGCHKKDNHVCVGWLMDQDKRNLPLIALRISMSRNNVTTEYLDSLHCKSKMYTGIEQMVKANYPELINEAENENQRESSTPYRTLPHASG